MNIAVLASGNGSNFEALAKAFPNDIKFVFSDRSDAYVLKRAKQLGVPHFSFELKNFARKADYERELVSLLDAHEIDLICLAGYMKIVGPTLLSHYEGKIINIHPSYLPAFAGSPHAIEESWQARRGLGVTVHYVDTGVDTGQIIAQEPVAYLPDLEAYESSLHTVEHQLYPAVVKKIIDEKEKRNSNESLSLRS